MVDQYTNIPSPQVKPEIAKPVADQYSLEIPEGFVPMEEADIPEGFVPIEEAQQSGLISKTKASKLPMIGAYEPLNKIFLEIPGITSRGKYTGSLREMINALATSFLISVSSDEETAKIMESKFPGSKVVKDGEGGTVFVSPEGKEYALDVPGIDVQDIARMATEGLGFMAFPGRTVTGAAAQAAGKQTAIESGQGLGGGTFDPGTIAASTVGAGVAQGVTTLIGRGITSLRAGAEQVVQDGQRLGAPVLTSDVIDPEASSAIARMITRISDKYPGIGTASERAQQRQVRNSVGENLAREFDLTHDLERWPQAAAMALERTHAGNVARAAEMRTRGLEIIRNAAPEGPPPIARTLRNINEQVEELNRLGMASDAPVIRILEDAAETLPRAQTFEELAFVRTRLIRAVKEAERGMSEAFPYEAASRLTRAKTILDREMQAYANAISPRAGRLWRDSNRMFAEEYSAYDRTILAKIANEGDMAAEKLMSTLASTNSKNLRQLYNQMDASGRAYSRAAIIQNAIEKSGYYIDEFKPFKLANEFNKPNVRIFFQGEERAQLDGLARYIRATKDSQAAKDITQTGIGLAELGLAPVAVLGKIYQSQAMRNLLLSLSRVNPRTTRGEQIIGRIRDELTRAQGEITGAAGAATPEAVKEVME